MSFRKIKPMLAKLGSKEDLKREEFWWEPKLDGTRALVYKIDEEFKLINRRGKILNSRYPELMKIKENIKKDSVLDGEIVIMDKSGNPDFYKLSEREHVSDPLRIKLLSETMPATYIVFDILQRDGEDLKDKPLFERKEILKEVVKEGERLVLCFYTENGEKLYKVAKKKKLEGIMGKEKESLYYPGQRKDCWIKVKHLKTLDCVIAGYTTGTGKRKELLGSLIAGCYHKGKLRYVGKIGTGFTEQMLKKLLEKLGKIKTRKCPFKEEPDLRLPKGREAIWVKPKYICEVRFMNLSEDKIMRAPAFMRLRRDKELHECVLLA